ncbi:MAG TPA: purine-binding chemotaxis protein CheW [Firmicutes bacterium]|nr:purine-binding chemotaxis protein CheW [Bacillota bacterium]
MERLTKNRQVVIFKLGEKEYGIPILSVQEIIRPQSPTKLPNSPGFIRGIISLRGKVIPIIDLAQRFGIMASSATYERRYIVIEVRGNTVGIIVDSVSEVLAVVDDNIKPPVENLGFFDTRYISGILTRDEGLVILIDIEKIFLEDELLALQEAGTETQEP